MRRNPKFNVQNSSYGRAGWRPRHRRGGWRVGQRCAGQDTLHGAVPAQPVQRRSGDHGHSRGNQEGQRRSDSCRGYRRYVGDGRDGDLRSRERAPAGQPGPGRQRRHRYSACAARVGPDHGQRHFGERHDLRDVGRPHRRRCDTGLARYECVLACPGQRRLEDPVRRAPGQCATPASGASASTAPSTSPFPSSGNSSGFPGFPFPFVTIPGDGSGVTTPAPGQVPGTTRPRTPQSPAQPNPAPRPAITPSQDTSHNWSGYAATEGKYTSVSGTWTVPQVSSNGAPGVGASWVGIGGVNSRDLIQAGTQETDGGSGRVQYSAWVETLPQVSRAGALRGATWRLGHGDHRRAERQHLVDRLQEQHHGQDVSHRRSATRRRTRPPSGSSRRRARTTASCRWITSATSASPRRRRPKTVRRST